MSPIELAAVLAAVVVIASIISVELGVTVALIELTLGVVVGNVFHLGTAGWLDFLAKFGSIVLTFLAGMEVDPTYMKRRLSAALGLVMSRHYAEHREEQRRLRVVAFAFLTPFFFLKGGLNVSLGAVVANLGLLGALLAAKMAPKVLFIFPLARRAIPRHATFTTLLMSTGLTFGTISSLYGLNAGIIDRTQFSLLITVVVLSAVVPTAVAERRFSPDSRQELEHEARVAAIPAEEYF